MSLAAYSIYLSWSAESLDPLLSVCHLLVPRQATFARNEIARSSSLSRLRLRQAI
jgi:hypothetical protein